ncbi:MAG: pyridoxamine 5'-phosphate oxidase [Alphaproteobacteria bacterium]|jgi:pyridoxamine 5'-phosphate oxidase|nr:pyridoxamine 5'-phosphate oxidase [Alphaproteobacteria bacterium]
MVTPVTDDPIAQFNAWLEEAQESEPNDPNAVSLATADATGAPSVRMVLLKRADADGFVFYTNFESRKGQELLANPRAALGFHWKSLRRQVRVEGPVTQVPDEIADAYFASRDRKSRIGAWASKQSRPLDAPHALEREVAKHAAKFGLGEVPRPPYWGGFCLAPTRIEFWRSGAFRLHDRLVYSRDDTAQPQWRTERLFP